MKVGYIYGVWDMLHVGHVNLINRASETVDYLIVGVVKNDAVSKTKGNNRPIVDEYDRGTIVYALKGVKEVFLQDDFDPTDIIKKINMPPIMKEWMNRRKINVLFLGEDQRHITDLNYYANNEIEIVRLPRTEGVSTTDLEKKIKGA